MKIGAPYTPRAAPREGDREETRSAQRGAVSIASGVDYFPGFLDRAAQEALRDEVMAILVEAPPFRPRMPRTGKPFSVLMSNCGPLGWVSDEAGYRYQPTHPETGRPWPPMPPRLLAAFAAIAPDAPAPEACLVNLYDSTARMGLHQDRDGRNSPPPSSRYRSGIRRSSASADFNATRRRARSVSPRATRCRLAGPAVSPFTASIASSQARRPSCLRAAGSI